MISISIESSFYFVSRIIVNLSLYKVQKLDSNKLKIVTPALDDASIVRLQTWSDDHIQDLKVNKNGVDGKYEILDSVSINYYCRSKIIDIIAGPARIGRLVDMRRGAK